MYVPPFYHFYNYSLAIQCRCAIPIGTFMYFAFCHTCNVECLPGIKSLLHLCGGTSHRSTCRYVMLHVNAPCRVRCKSCKTNTLVKVSALFHCPGSRGAGGERCVSINLHLPGRRSTEHAQYRPHPAEAAAPAVAWTVAAGSSSHV